MSSALVIRLTELFLGRGMSDLYMLNKVGDRTPSCGSPALMFGCLVVVCSILLAAFQVVG